MGETVLLGLDGGASKTKGVLLDRQGAILAQADGPGSAIVGHPKPESCQVLSSVTKALCAEAGVAETAIAHCGLGLNGIDFADEFEDQHATLAETLGLTRERLTLVNDGIVALWAASPEPASLISRGSASYFDPPVGPAGGGGAPGAAGAAGAPGSVPGAGAPPRAGGGGGDRRARGHRERPQPHRDSRLPGQRGGGVPDGRASLAGAGILGARRRLLSAVP